MTDSDTGRSGMDRRTLIKRGAAAGALAWTAPTILSGSAHAQDSGFDGVFTGCVPDVTYELIQAPQNCRDWNNFVNNNFPGLLPTLDPSCCQESVFGVAIPDNITCGAACEAVPVVPPGNIFFTEIKRIVTSVGDAFLSDIRTRNASCDYTPNEPPEGDPNAFKFVDPASCAEAGSVTLEIVTGVKCEDEVCYLLQDIVRFDIPNCPDRAPGILEARTIAPFRCPTT